MEKVKFKKCDNFIVFCIDILLTSMLFLPMKVFVVVSFLLFSVSLLFEIWKNKNYIPALIITTFFSLTILRKSFTLFETISEKYYEVFPFSLFSFFPNQSSYLAMYLAILLTLLIIVFLYLSPKKNKEVYKAIGFVLEVSIIEFLYLLYIKYEIVYFDCCDFFFFFAISYYWVFLLEQDIVELYTQRRAKERNGYENLGEELIKDLLPSRKEDYKILKSYILDESCKIIGINGDWGVGKSFLSKKIKEVIKTEYYIITINLLSLKIDNLQETILSKINNLLLGNRIYSSSSAFMDELEGIGSHWYSTFSNIFFQKTKGSASIEELASELVNKLDRKVIVFFEDIDRLYDHNKVLLIFDLVEQMKSSKLKFIFEFSYKRLQEQEPHQFSYEFLEKYLPFSVNLSEDAFETKLGLVLSAKDSLFDDLFKVQEVAMTYFDRPDPNFFFLNKSISMRQIENFVNDVKAFLLGYEVTNQDFRRVVVFYYFLKHCYPDLAMKLSDTKSILDIAFFDYWDENNQQVRESFNSYAKKITGKIEKLVYSEKFFIGVCVICGFGINIGNAKNPDNTYANNIEQIDNYIRKTINRSQRLSTAREFIEAKLKEIVLVPYKDKSEINLDNLKRFRSIIWDEFKNNTEITKYFNDETNHGLYNLFKKIFTLFEIETNKMNLINLYFQAFDSYQVEFSDLGYIRIREKEILFLFFEQFNALDITKINNLKDSEFYDFLNNVVECLFKTGLVDKGLSESLKGLIRNCLGQMDKKYRREITEQFLLKEFLNEPLENVLNSSRFHILYCPFVGKCCEVLKYVVFEERISKDYGSIKETMVSYV